jgi:hypothetical protein
MGVPSLEKAKTRTTSSPSFNIYELAEVLVLSDDHSPFRE